MVINTGAPVFEHFFSDFVDILKNKASNPFNTRYKLHVYDSAMTHEYYPGIDNDVIYKLFIYSVLRQIAIDGVAIVLVTNDFGKMVYIIASDD